MNEWTIQRLLTWVTEYLTQKGVDSPRLSAELLLSHVLGLKRIELYTQYNKVVAQEQLTSCAAWSSGRASTSRSPISSARTEFYSIEFEVTPDCLIPRPETELLVQRSIEFLRKRTGPQQRLRSVHRLWHHRGRHREKRPGRESHRDGHLRARLGRGGQEHRETQARGADRTASRGPLRAAGAATRPVRPDRVQSALRQCGRNTRPSTGT